MREIPSTTPRRQPRQARAQATVDAIIEGTARVLVNQGYDRTSTNRVAATAGVSIGSLYQYFPSKEALVASVAEDLVKRMTTAMSNVLSRAVGTDITSDARLVIEGLIAAYRVDPALHDVLCQEVPKVGELQKVYAFERQLGALATEYLAPLHDRIRLSDVDRAVFLLVHAIPGAVRAAVQADPQGFNDARLAEELSDLVLRYLVDEAA
jgi:AcrR family transcriptional regulator